MRKISALLLSLCVHIAFGGLVYFFHHSQPTVVAENDFLIAAPLGDVFVQEEAAPGVTSTQPVAKGEQPAETTGEGKEAGTSAPNNQPGLPDGEAHPIGLIQPSYPPISQKLGEAGEAIFLLGIDAGGAVTSATLEHSTGHERLDNAARAAVLAAQFQPAVEGGQPILSIKRFRIEFRLNSEKHGN